jgi:hypothetical protein
MRKKSVLALLALASLPLAAQAQVTHTRSVVLDANDKPLSIQIPKFNGNQGQLAGVKIDIRSQISGSLNVENLSKQTRTAIVQAYFGTAVHGLEGEILLFSSGDFSQTHRLHAYDGKLDYAGASGTMMGFEGSTPAVSLELMDEWADMRPFMLKGGKDGRTLDLTVQSIGNYELQGLREAAAELEIEVELIVRVTYLIQQQSNGRGKNSSQKPDKSLSGQYIIKSAAPDGQRDDRNNYTPPVTPAPAVKPRDYGQKI